MKPPPKDVEQPLSVPCQRLEFSLSGELSLSDELGLSDELSLSDELGRSEVARASRRAASASGPTLALTQTPRLSALKPPNLPQPVWVGAAKVCQKTDKGGGTHFTPGYPISCGWLIRQPRTCCTISE